LIAAQRRVDPFTYGESRHAVVDEEMLDAALGGSGIAGDPASARRFPAETGTNH